MAKHNELGKAGEDAAANYLELQGYAILHRNWRKGHLEIDIIATKDNNLVFVEVKTRKNTLFAEPEDAIDLRKIKHIVRAADSYVRQNQTDAWIRFDVITVVGEPGHFTIDHIESAFDVPMF